MQHSAPAAPAPLPSSATPSWRTPAIPNLRIVRWVVVAAGVLTVLVSVGSEPTRCTPSQPCTAAWDFSLFIAMLVASVVLLWRWPVTGLALGIVYALGAVLLDPAWPGKVAAAVYGALCAVLLVRLVTVRRRRVAELASAAGRTTVPDWVRSSARAAGELPWPLLHVGGAAIGLVTALVGLGLLIGSWTGYQDRLERAVQTWAIVAEADPEDPFAVTLQVDGAAPGAERPDIYTVEEYALGTRVPVRVDPQDPGWAELVAEPWDETYWLSLALLGLLAAGVLGAEAVRERRSLTGLLEGTHPAVRVCAAPLPGSPFIGIAHLDDRSRRVWAVIDADLALDRHQADRSDRPGDPAVDDDGETSRWVRPTEAVLYGRLGPEGGCALLLGSTVVLAPGLLERPEGVTDLADPSPRLPLPRDLEHGAPTEEEELLMRAEAFGDATHVGPATAPPVLPLTVPGPAWRRVLAALQVVVGIAAVPLVMLLVEDVALTDVGLAAFLGGWASLTEPPTCDRCSP